MERIIMLVIWLSLFGCSELFEKDISKDEMILVSPIDRDTLNAGSVTFWWHELDQAREYELQVVLGSFDQPERLLLDSTIRSNSFTFSLTSGVYEWRAKGLNGSSQTEPVIRRFTVDSVYDLSTEAILLTSPMLSACTADSSVLFSWQELAIPGTYTFDLRIGPFSDENIYQRVDIEETVYSMILPAELEGQLSWGVRLSSDQGATPYSFRELNFDFTPPSQPVPVAPLVGDTLTSGNVTLEWSSSSSLMGCAEYDVVTVYSDTMGMNTKEVVVLENGELSYVISLQPGFYSWIIQRKDDAGNSSESTSLSKFYVE